MELMEDETKEERIIASSILIMEEFLTFNALKPHTVKYSDIKQDL